MEKIRLLVIVLIIQQNLLASQDPLASFYATKNSSETDTKEQTHTVHISLGRVSMDLLFLLHPQMREYNFATDSFFQKIPSKLSVPLEFYLKDRHKKFQKFNALLLVKRRETEKLIRQLTQQKDVLRQNYINSNNSLLNSNKDLEQVGEKYEAIEQEYWATRLNYENQIKDTKAKLQNWISSNNKELFVDRKTRDELFNQIVKEIKETVSQLAKSRNIQIVINRNAKSLGAKKGLLQLLEKPFVPMNNNPLKDFTADKFFFNYQKLGTSEQYLNTFNTHLKHYESIEKMFSKVYEQFDTLGKVQDLTLPSLNLLFQRYKYPKKFRLKLLNIIKNWRES